MGTNEIISLILSFLTIAIAVIALFQSSKQTKLSNKQSLFNERVKKYIKLEDIFNTYVSSTPYLQLATEEPRFLFQIMTKNAIFMEGNFDKGIRLSQTEENRFLNEMEDLRSVALEISLLWNNEEAKIASDFINAYVMLLLDLFKQRILISKVDNNGYDHEIIKAVTKDVNLPKHLKQIEELSSKLTNEEVLNKLKNDIILK